MADNPFAKLHASILSQPTKPRDNTDELRAKAAESRRIEAFKRSLGQRYAGCSLDSFEVSDDPMVRNSQLGVLASLQSFVDDVGKVIAGGCGMFLYGPVGTGKDHLLSAVMLGAVNRGFDVAWFNGLDIFAGVRNAISEDESEDRLFERLTLPTVLAISDPVPPLGEVKPFQRAALLRAIDARYRRAKPTWVTINVPNREEADARLGVQLADRLTDEALCLCCNWTSYRVQRRWRAQG
jgi:DNA replication protein DnaC